MAEYPCAKCKEVYDHDLGDCPVCVANADDAAAMDEPPPADTPDEPEDQPGKEPQQEEPIVPVGGGMEAADGEVGAGETVDAGAGETGDSDAAIKAFFEQLEKVKRKGQFAILFFGFKAAGKTWLLHRMKEQLFKQGISCHERFEEIRVRPGERKELPATSEIEFHHVLDRPPFVLIDIPGEFTEHVLNWDFSELQMMLAAVDYAKAIIIAMPSDVLIFGDYFPEEDEELFEAAGLGGDKGVQKTRRKNLAEWAKGFRVDNDHLGRFAEGMHDLAGLMSFVRSRNIDYSDDKQFQEITRQDVLDHMEGDDFVPVGGADGLDCPVFIALTKADRILSLFHTSEDSTWKKLDSEIAARPDSQVFTRLDFDHEEIRSRIRDPWAAVHHVRPDLHRELRSAFPLAKFDYATAFYGHDGLPSLTRGHYKKHPQRGVVEILEWIRDATMLRSRSRLLRKPYAWALRTRHYVEGIKPRPRFNFAADRHR